MKLHFNQVAGSILNVKPDKRNECFNFGIDNAFPSLIEALINMSVTSKICADKVAKAIYGGSFGDAGKIIVNGKGESLNEVLRIAARQYAKHNNVYLAIGYNGEYEVKSISVIPVTDVRVGKADDNEYSGKFIIYNNWDNQRSKKKVDPEDFLLVDRFSRNIEILKKQIETAGEIKKYKGQLLHIKKDTAYIYSLTDLNPVLSEAYLESNSQTFRSQGVDNGFLNAKLLATQPFKNDTERKAFSKNLKKVRGAVGAGGVVLLEASVPSEDLSKQLVLEDLTSDYNDSLLTYSDAQAEKNICKAFTVPLMLVNPSDNSLFGNSGELLKQAKITLYEDREEDRDQLEEVFSYLMSRFKTPVENLEILNPYIENIKDVKEAVEEVVEP